MRKAWVQLTTFFAIGALLYGVKSALLAPEDARTVVQISHAKNALAGSVEREQILLAQAALDEGLAALDPVLEERLRALFPELSRSTPPQALSARARKLGLFHADPLLRTRLALRKELALRAAAFTREEPSPAELRSFFSANSARYQRPARASFTHVFVARDAHGAQTQAVAAKLRDKLTRDHAGPRDAASYSQPTNLPLTFEQVSLSDLRVRFGVSFAAALPDLAIARWSEPLPSAFGYHLVYLEAYHPAAPRTLAEAYPQVLGDYLAARQKTTYREALAALSKRYTVVVIP